MGSYISYLVFGVNDQQFNLAETRMAKLLVGLDPEGFTSKNVILNEQLFSMSEQ